MEIFIYVISHAENEKMDSYKRILLIQHIMNFMNF